MSEQERPPETPRIFVTLVGYCARCGQSHNPITFKRFTRPPLDGNNVCWTHWGTCPVTGDPVLLNITEEPTHDAAG